MMRHIFTSGWVRSCLVTILTCLSLLHCGKGTHPPATLPDNADWPLELPRRLSGTLGEIRGTSMHYGIDIKTNGRNGYRVNAIADGEIKSLISKPWGYGKGIYLRHNDDYMSVYGHLDAFENKSNYLNDLVSLLHVLYFNHSVFYSPRHHPLRFKKGDTIAYTGETGSGYPHLHLEYKKGDVYLNPAAIFPSGDDMAPVITAIFLCRERGNTTIEETMLTLTTNSKKKYGKLITTAPVTLTPGEKYFLKLSCYDRVNARNPVVPYEISYSLHGTDRFSLQFNRLTKKDLYYGSMIYDISRSTIDGKPSYTYFLCRRTGNNATCIDASNENGYLNAKDGGQTAEIRVSDIEGNITIARIPIIGSAKSKNKGRGKGWQWIPRNKLKNISTSDKSCSIELPAYALPASSFIALDKVQNRKTLAAIKKKTHGTRIFSVYNLKPHDTLLRKKATITIQAPPGINARVLKRITICQSYPGKKPRKIHTTYHKKNGVFKAKSRKTGYFTLLMDYSPPSIYLPPVHEMIQHDNGMTHLRIHAADNLTGVNPFALRCFINGEKASFTYDHDRKWIDILVPAGKNRVHHLLIKCPDYAGNWRTYRNLVTF